MDSYNRLPDKEIVSNGTISTKFLSLNISSFKEACLYVHNLRYGYNSDKDDELILFKEQKGSCTTKHGVIAKLAEELAIPLYKKVGIYKLTEKIVTGTKTIIEKYGLPYVPMVHCFLAYKDYRFDLTEGNNNGKNRSIEEFIHEEQVKPFISRKDEYILFLKVLQEKVLPSQEMQTIERKTILKARAEAIILLKEKVE
jgi:hypothetical protein